MQEATRSPRSELLQGVRDELPLLIGVIPFGLIFGALAVSGGIAPLEAQGFSLIVFAGSAQFAAVNLIASGAPYAVALATIVVLNLRHLLYSASLSPQLSRLPWRWKIPLSWLLTDEAFAVTWVHLQKQGSMRVAWYMLGAGLTLWLSWQASTAAGIALGAGVPEDWQLDFALPLTFLAMLVPVLKERPSQVSAAVAGGLAVVLFALPYRFGLVLAVVGGVGAGLWPGGRRRSTEAR